MPIRIIRSNGTIQDIGQNEMTKIRSEDPILGFLEDKIIAGDNVTVVVDDSSTSEKLVINALASAGANTVKVSTDDTTPNTLINKLTAGEYISLTILNPEGNETLEIDVTGVLISDIAFTPSVSGNWNGTVDTAEIALDQVGNRVKALEDEFPIVAGDVGYTVNDGTDWDSSPTVVSSALDQLASRLKTVEAGSTAPDASEVTYTPLVLGNWGGVDPGNSDDAFDYLANKIENLLDAEMINFTASANSNWDGNVNPGIVDEALNQLAERVKDVEDNGANGSLKVISTDTTFGFLEDKLVAGSGITLTTNAPTGNSSLTVALDNVDATDVTYVPDDLTDWASNLDPGNTDDALDQLASRLKVVEAGSTAPDASEITYTPSTLANWTGSADPGDVDNALDQLASRVKANEDTLDGELHEVKATTGDTTPGVLWAKLVAGSGITLEQVNPEANAQVRIVNGIEDATDVPFDSGAPANWDSSISPGNISLAADQLASRVKIIETVGVEAEIDSLSDIGDVTITSVADEQVLIWVAANSRWENAEVPSSGGGGTIDVLKVVGDSDPNLNSGNSKYIDWVSAQINDFGHSITFSTTSIAVPVTGRYRITASAGGQSGGFAFDARYTLQAQLHWSRTGDFTNYVLASGQESGVDFDSGDIGFDQYLTTNLSNIRDLAAGDTLRLYVSWWQQDADNINFEFDVSYEYTYMILEKIG
jgi:hypothetical protein